RELHTWSKLRHTNILDILGLAVFRNDKLAMISPWMRNGNVMQYIARHPGLDKYSMVAQVAEAVVYLHVMNVVHGDLKGDNILVADNGTLKLTDFGLTMMHEQIVRFSTTDAGGGTYRWMAPELMQGESARSKETDMYALGMVSSNIHQIFTEKLPFPDIRSDAVIINNVVTHGLKPKCPTDLMQSRRDQMLWNALDSCWIREPMARATAENIQTQISTLQVMGEIGV
ncbi:kinase-like protein, partial [Ceratobasidium sp. AG-I]